MLPPWEVSMVDAVDPVQVVAARFELLLELNDAELRQRASSERILFYLVHVRCQIERGGFTVMFEQALDEGEWGVLIDGLRRLGRRDLAGALQTGVDALAAEGYFAS